jgi:hypothetical protein
MFEMRLIRGKRIFWGPLPRGGSGRVFLTVSPRFCHTAEFPGHCNFGTGGIWDLHPLDERTRKNLLQEYSGTGGTLELKSSTPGIGSISFEQASSMVGVALYLSIIEFDKGGLSAFEDWAQIIRSSVDDTQKDVLLRLKFDHITAEQIDEFTNGRNLISTDLELQVRPRTRQWPGED